MPIARVKDTIVYFAHIPKCGGTSVDRFLRSLTGELHFHDPKYMKRDEAWTRSSPQHVEWNQMEILFGERFFDHKFTLVRHPARRVISAFNHSLKIGRISSDVPIHDFVGELAKQPDFFSHRYDNHFVPANRIAPSDSKVFHLEKDMEALEKWLLDIFDMRESKHRIGHDNKGKYASEKTGKSGSMIKNLFMEKKKDQVPVRPEPDDMLLELVHRVYREDYERFGFEIRPKSL